MATKAVFEKVDQLNFDAIRQIRKSKNLASFDLVCKMLKKHHDLDESFAMSQLTSLLAMKRVENIPTKDGLESLKISESKEKLSIKSKVEDRKGRKLSNDEDRIIKCRNELQAVAEIEGFDVPEISKSYDSICDTNSVQDRSDIEGVARWVENGFMDGEKYESKNDDALKGEKGTYLKRDFAQHSLNTVTELASAETKKRLEILEGQISNILNRLDNQDVEWRDSRQLTQKDFQ